MDEFERRDLFNKAADVLEQQGWVTGHMEEYPPDQSSIPSHCMVGALRIAKYGDAYPDLEELWDDEGGSNEEYAGIKAGVMITWNDKAAEDVHDVVKRLREMAAGKWDDEAQWKTDIRERAGIEL